VNRLMFLATHWVNQNGGVYGQIGKNSEVKEVLSDLKTGFTNLLQNNTDFLGNALRWVAVGLGLAIEAVLRMEGINLTNIIFGRLVAGVEMNKFAFELVPGNVYGIVGAMCYSVLRTAVISFMVIVAAFLLCKGIWLGNGEKALAQFKNSLGNYLLSAALLFIMPHIFEVLIYVRDLLLFKVGSISGATESGDFMQGYRHLATSVDGMFDLGPSIFEKEFWTEYNYSVEGSFFAGLMYLGMVCMTVYFAYTYVTNALSQMIAFVMFPLIALLSVKDSKTLSKWFSSVVALMAVPLVDSVLFAIPLKFAVGMDASNAYRGSFTLFLVCMALLPARKVVRNWIGGETFSSASGMAALLMVGRMATQAVGAARNYSSSMADAGADRQRATMYRELAGDPRVRITDGGAAAMSVSGGTGKNVRMNEFSSERAKRMAEKYVNVDNFEDREFANILSDDQRAHFYDQRAKRAEAKARGAVIGGVAGGLGGFGATLFGGPAVQMAGMSMGATLGGVTGSKMSGRKTVPYVKPEQLERASGEVVSKEEVEAAFAEDGGEYEFVPKRNLHAIGTGPIKMEENNPAARFSLPENKGFARTVTVDASGGQDTVTVLGMGQYNDAVENVLGDASMKVHFDAIDAGDMSKVSDVTAKVAEVYAGLCGKAKFEGASKEALQDSVGKALEAACKGFSGDSEEFKTLIKDGGDVANAAGLSFGNLGKGLGGAEEFEDRFRALSDTIAERRIGKHVNVVEFSVRSAEHPMWNLDNVELQNEAIRQTAAGYVRECAMEIVDAASPNSLYSEKKEDAMRLTEEFCHGFDGDDLCKILGVDADIVRAYRPV